MVISTEIKEIIPAIRLAVVPSPRPQVVKMKGGLKPSNKPKKGEQQILLPPITEFNTGFLKARKYDPL